LPYEKVGKNEPVCIADEVPFDIPDSWEWVRLVNLSAPTETAFADGPFGSNLKKEHYTENEEVRIIQLSNIGEEGWRNHNIKYTTHAHAKTLERSCVEPGNIVIAKMMPAGRAIVVPEINSHYILSSDAVKFVPNQILDKNYLLYAINSDSFRGQVVAEAHGVTRVRTSLTKLKTYLLPVPPINEQKRIVQKLDSLKPYIDHYNILEGKRKILDQSFPDQLKKSILQEAVQGKLVPQDPNDEPASVLLERIREEKQQLIKEGKIKKDKHESVIYRRDNSHYEKRGLEEICIDDEIPFEIPDTWEWARLGMISTYSHTKRKINAQNADPAMWGLDLEDIEKGGKLLVHKTVGERNAIGDKTVFDKGDILYSKLRPYLLKILIAPDSGICTPEIVPFKVFGNIDSEYIVAFLKCPYVDMIINSVTYGVKMPRVGTNTMTDMLIPVPPIQEQHRIVSAIMQLLPKLSTL